MAVPAAKRTRRDIFVCGLGLVLTKTGPISAVVPIWFGRRGRKSLNQDLAARPRTPIVVVALTAAIVLTYAAFWMAPESVQDRIDYAFALIPSRFDPASRDHFNSWWEPIGPVFGHAFLHAAWWHAGLNAFFLYATGRIPALRLGVWRFLALYFFSAAIGAAAFVGLNWGETGAAIGASDAVCGVFMAYFLSVRPNWRESLAIPAVRNQLGMIVLLNVVLMGALTEFGLLPIAWEGHLGGFVGGALAYIALERRRLAGP